jgi:tRNA-dihydrouridine synthase A
MMDWTDRHCRTFHRQLTKHALLYSEMVTAPAILNGDRARLLGMSDIEHPVALQLGGSDPAALAEAAAIGETFGYDEINLNIGCPSDRVQEGRFGACLMAEPELVGACVAAMQQQVKVPVTVKCRIGIDEQDSERDLQRFIDVVAGAGVRTFIVHARKAWLQGLSPKQNREVPPLDYARVYRLKAAHPELTIVINGGIADLNEAADHLQHVDGVMLGDRRFFDANAAVPTRAAAIEGLLPHIEGHLAGGGRLNNVVRHVLGLYHGEPRARVFRRHLSENAPRDGAGLATLIEAVSIADPSWRPLAAAE